MKTAIATDRPSSDTAAQMLERPPSANRFLEGSYAPVTEERTEFELCVTGEIPAEMHGSFVRNGPNPLHVEDRSLYHWFAGDAMLHGLNFRRGRANWYRNRWVGSNRVNTALGRPLAPGPRHASNDSVNTNVIGHAGRLWALVEAGAVPVEVDADLTTIRHSYFGSDLARAFSAHPHRDPATGALHAICYDSANERAVSYARIGASGSVERILDIPVEHGPMIHDCAVTSSYVVVLDLPVTLSPVASLKGSPFPYRWNPSHRARVGLLPHDGDAAAISWFDVDPCYVFHTANAFETADGTVILDCVVHDTMFDDSAHGPDSKKVAFERWTLDPRTSRVRRDVRDDTKQEFPRYDERRSTKPYRYAYTIGADFAGTHGEPLLRHDLERGTVLAHDYGADRITDEVVFVPRLADGAEDDGWLVSFVFDLREGRSDFVIVNAADVSGEPQAIVHLPVAVPRGFHGNWIPSVA